MLFNSPEFLFLFLPVAAAGYFVLGARGAAAARLWLVAASLVFYGWWNPAYLPLLLLSLAANYGCGEWLARTRERRLLTLWLGLGFNLALLGYYKYAAFAVRTADAWLGEAWPVPHVVLPLGISFFTFLQITYLVDLYRREPVDREPGGYALFVTFFPHLLAGPIIHHREMMPQFAKRETYRFSAADFSVGLALFTLGLAKKVLIADGLAKYANQVFGAVATAAPGVGIAPATLWFGALAYTFQLYFDFSGYSDMAIGLARMFGIRFPENFDSPYKARSLVDFWRRWHMTLSRLLRDYVYIPLGGNRRGPFRRGANLLATMLLAGLWHGAGWTYVVWGGVHGVGLLANHAWDDAAKRRAWLGSRPMRIAGWAATFLFVVAAWVVFRAADLPAALRMLHGMFLWQATPGPDIGMGFRARHWLNLPLLLAIVLFCPNTREILARYAPVLRSPAPGPRRGWQWAPTAAWGAVLAALFAYAVLSLGDTREFLYYQF